MGGVKDTNMDDKDIFYKATKACFYFSVDELEMLLNEFNLGHLKLAIKLKQKDKRWKK